MWNPVITCTPDTHTHTHTDSSGPEDCSVDISDLHSPCSDQESLAPYPTDLARTTRQSDRQQIAALWPRNTRHDSRDRQPYVHGGVGGVFATTPPLCGMKYQINIYQNLRDCFCSGAWLRPAEKEGREGFRAIIGSSGQHFTLLEMPVHPSIMATMNVTRTRFIHPMQFLELHKHNFFISQT